MALTFSRPCAHACMQQGDSVAAMEAFARQMAQKQAEKEKAEQEAEEEAERKRSEPLLNETSFDRRKVRRAQGACSARNHLGRG